MSAPILEAETMEAMHEFVYDYCKDITGEPDHVYFHEMIDDPKKRTWGGTKGYIGDNPDGLLEDWIIFCDEFQEYLSNNQ